MLIDCGVKRRFSGIMIIGWGDYLGRVHIIMQSWKYVLYEDGVYLLYSTYPTVESWLYDIFTINVINNYSYIFYDSEV